MEKLISSFDSFGDLLRQAQKPAVWRGYKASIKTDDSWTGTRTFEEAMNLATYGWPEGRKKLLDNLQIAAKKQVSRTHAKNYDVGGMYPDVPMYCAGEPAYMVTQENEIRHSKPIVRLLLQKFVSAMVSSENIMNQGAAILSCVDSLENDGHSCEIEMVLSGAWTRMSGTKQEIRWIAKRAGEPLELDRMAFQLIQPAMFRRILFRINEQNPKAERGNGSYWIPTNSPEVEPGQIYFEQPSGSEYRTIEHAISHVTQRLQTSGVEIVDPLKYLADKEFA